MTEGSYRSMDLGELTAAFDHLGPQAQLFRPVLDIGDEPDRVVQAFVGPTVVSTCVGLVPVTSEPIWDVNGYYRAVGIAWPYRPTRRELLLGYLSVDGQKDRYATYAFKRLLDAEFRRHYDRRPLGEPVDDVYRWEMVRRLAAEWASKQSRVTGRTVTVKDILGEDLTERMEREAEAEAAEAAQAASEPEEHDPDRPAAEAIVIWPYSFYLWNSRKIDDSALVDWQAMLIRSCAARGLSFQLAVGYCARTPGAAARMWHVKPGGEGVEIAFLHEDAEPSQELADVVVATYHTGHARPARPIHLQYPAQ